MTMKSAARLLAGLTLLALVALLPGCSSSDPVALEGDEKCVEKAFELVKSIKGEPPVKEPNSSRLSSAKDYNYDPRAQFATLGGV